MENYCAVFAHTDAAGSEVNSLAEMARDDIDAGVGEADNKPRKTSHHANVHVKTYNRPTRSAVAWLPTSLPVPSRPVPSIDKHARVTYHTPECATPVLLFPPLEGIVSILCAAQSPARSQACLRSV